MSNLAELPPPISPDGMPIKAISEEAIQHGEVFTRRWIVDLILDLVGYTPELDLAGMRTVDPACGSGAFLVAVTERLSQSCRRHGRSLLDAGDAVQAFDLLPRHVEKSRRAVRDALVRDGWDAAVSERAVSMWITTGDYLLRSHDPESADFVVGNPPYIRLEEVPDARMDAYRRACPTMVGRADIYVGFYETALASLKPDGVLGFICADRWMRNQYGRDLRRLVAKHYSVDAVISMHDVDAFEEQVSAYPAITVLRSGKQGRALVAETTRSFGPDHAREVVARARDEDAAPVSKSHCQVATLPHWFGGEESWPAGGPGRLAMIEHLADHFPPLEDGETRTRVGIGVATGADGVFITRDQRTAEQDRLLPLAMVPDTTTGELRWSGHYLVNPWTTAGDLVDLEVFPNLKRYYERNRVALSKRHVASRNPAKWYRTIDKVDHRLTGRPKLLIPDMKLTIHPVLDENGFYPHHNLYYVVSDTWDLRVLGGLLLSRVAQAFIEAYAVKMRGGTLRFQAQYLRRIRVPHQGHISQEDRLALAQAFDQRDVEAATQVAIKLYEINEIPDCEGPRSFRCPASAPPPEHLAAVHAQNCL